MQRDLLVIGAGLAGSSLAAALSSLGHDVLLVERRALPHQKVCGEFLSPEAQASLWALGLYETVATLAPSQIDTARLVGHYGHDLTMVLPGVAWGLSRFALDAALAAAASRAGAELCTGVTATELRATPTGWQVTLRSPQGQQQVQARAVVLACGRHAPPGLRAARHAPLPQRSYVGAKCHYSGVTMPPHVELYLFPGGYVGLNPIEAGRANLCALVTPAAFRRAGGSVRTLLAALVADIPALARRLAGAQPLPASEVAVAPVDTGVAAVPWEQVARLGDAATMIPPLCGDGMAMALRAAELCVPLADDFLAGRITLRAWERAYRAAWHHEFDQRIRTGRWLQALFRVPGLADGLLGIGRVLPRLALRLLHTTRGTPRPLAEVSRLVPVVL